MIDNYRILYEGGTGEIVEKKSRFIANTRPVESEEEALSFIAEMRKKYWDASHNCSAFVIGEKNEVMRCSDDGEPGQTAGRPMLDVLVGEGVHNACVVVTRYFGGTLLGTGGLVRAYSKAAQEGLKGSKVVEKKLAKSWRLVMDYTELGKVQYIIGEKGISVMGSDYSDKVAMDLLVPVGDQEDLREKIVEGTNAKCRIEEGDSVYYGVIEKNIVLF